MGVGVAGVAFSPRYPAGTVMSISAGRAATGPNRTIGRRGKKSESTGGVEGCVRVTCTSYVSLSFGVTHVVVAILSTKSRPGGMAVTGMILPAAPRPSGNVGVGATRTPPPTHLLHYLEQWSFLILHNDVNFNKKTSQRNERRE